MLADNESAPPPHSKPMCANVGSQRQCSLDPLHSEDFSTHPRTADGLVKSLCAGLIFFSQLPYHRVQRMRKCFHIQRVREGGVVCVQGEECEGLFIVLCGKAGIRSIVHKGDACLSMAGDMGSKLPSTQGQDTISLVPSLEDLPPSTGEAHSTLKGRLSGLSGTGHHDSASTHRVLEDTPESRRSAAPMTQVDLDGMDLPSQSHDFGDEFQPQVNCTLLPSGRTGSMHHQLAGQRVLAREEWLWRRACGPRSLGGLGREDAAVADPSDAFGEEVGEVFPGGVLFEKEAQVCCCTLSAFL